MIDVNPSICRVRDEIYGWKEEKNCETTLNFERVTPRNMQNGVQVFAFIRM